MPKQKKEYSESSEDSDSNNSNISDTSSSDDNSDTENSINDTSETEYNDDDIRNIIYEDIDDSYAYARLGELDVIMMKKNGYINATKLCHKNKKEFTNWYQNKASKELIKAAGSVPGYPTDLILKRLQEPNDTRGTYVHPKIIIHVASWCSPNYALMVSDIVTEYHAKYAVEEKDKLIKRKDDKIDKLIKKSDKLREDLKRREKKAKLRHKELLRKHEESLRQHKVTQKKLENASNKLDTRSNDYVVSGPSASQHILSIVKTNEVAKIIKGKKYKPSYDYIAMRVMKKSYKCTLKRLKSEYPDMEILLEIKYTPNSMNLWARVKKKLSKHILVSGSRFNRVIGYPENRLIRDIKTIHRERYEY